MTPAQPVQVVLVTGAGSGIGRASAVLFAARGARVVVSDRDAASAEQTVKHIRDAGGDAHALPADVSHAAQVAALIEGTLTRYGRLDAAHNNAGIEGAAGQTADCPEDTWRRVIEVNLTGVWLCLKHELPVMVRQGGGAIVNTASVAGVAGLPGFSAYAASKHGIVGLTKTAAAEYAKAGIRINAVCPGLIQTPMVDRQTGGRPEVAAQWAAMAPMKRCGTPEEVAEAVVWLCSPGAAFVTGHTLIVDGGLLAQ